MGTFTNTSGLTAESDCITCSPGYYCEIPGLPLPTGLCAEGYYCSGGSTKATPFDSGANDFRLSYVGDTCIDTYFANDLCPAGHYCPAGSGFPIPCPAGRNSSSRGLTRLEDCPDCVGGYYCPNNATTNATLLCEQGYYCPPGSNSSSLECPEGSFCPAGSWQPEPCAPGSYQNQTRQAFCSVSLLLRSVMKVRLLTEPCK